MGRFLMGQAYHGPRYPLIEIETIGTIKWANQSVLALATTWSLYPDSCFSDHAVTSSPLTDGGRKTQWTLYIEIVEKLKGIDDFKKTVRLYFVRANLI